MSGESSDMSIRREDLESLRTLIGRRVDSYECEDPSPILACGYVTLHIDDRAIDLDWNWEPADYFGIRTDAVRFSVSANHDGAFKTWKKGQRATRVPVGAVIRDIIVVNDTGVSSEDEGDARLFRYTKAVVFNLGGKQLAFELDHPVMEYVAPILSPNALHEIDAPGADGDQGGQVKYTREFIALREW